MAHEHVVAGFVRHVTAVDAKRAPPHARYLVRYCVNRWITAGNDNRKMLTIMHVLIPEGKLLDYAEKFTALFQSWLPAPAVKYLTSEYSLSDLVHYTLGRPHSAYFITTLNFTDDSGHRLSFGSAVKKYNQYVPVHNPDVPCAELTWKVAGRPHGDDQTLSDMGISRPSKTSTQAAPGASAQPQSSSSVIASERPTTSSNAGGTAASTQPQSSRSLIVSERPTPSSRVTFIVTDSDVEIITTESDSETEDGLDTEQSATTIEDDPAVGLDSEQSATTSGEDPAVGLDIDQSQATSEEDQVVISCPVCFESNSLCVFDCGHIMCEGCIAMSRRICSSKCSICRKRWNSYRSVDMRTVSNTVCTRCKEKRKYIMPCSHGTCGCPNPVCRKCYGTNDVIRLYS